MMNTQMVDNRLQAIISVSSALVVGLTLTAFHGLVGLVAGVAILITWYVLAPVFAFAFSHIVLGAVYPNGIDMVQVAIIEAGFLGLLVESALRFESPRRLVTLFGGFFVALGLLVGGSYYLSGDTWLVALVLTGAVALLVYGIHRYDIVVIQQEAT
ncbi:hypothetical protein [Haladaptatus sp. DFWS20]|uniref:hypothetical protein n=1 Tax=Haladaptatus sp. DFWS20 TaxID=3403467 RepID=UPI003EB9726D